MLGVRGFESPTQCGNFRRDGRARYRLRRQGNPNRRVEEREEAAMFRLGERLTQMHDDYFRLRETIGALPTRSELRDIGDHLAERLTSLADRLDRAIDH
jgi:hypothetical protein